MPLNPSEVQLQSCAGCCMPAQNTFDPFDHCSLWVRITVGCLVQQTSQAPSSATGSALLHIQLTALSTNTGVQIAFQLNFSKCAIQSKAFNLLEKFN